MLKQRLSDTWSGMQQSVIDESIDQWCKRPKACVKANRKQLEHLCPISIKASGRGPGSATTFATSSATKSRTFIVTLIARLAAFTDTSRRHGYNALRWQCARGNRVQCIIITKPPGTVVPCGLMFYCGFFSSLFFFQREISELPPPIAVKLCHMIGSVFSFIITVEKFGGPYPPKFFLWPKTCKIWTTSNFHREYLRTERDIQNRKDTSSTTAFGENKSGELWSTNNTVGHVSLDPRFLYIYFFIFLFFGCYYQHVVVNKI